MNSRVYMLLDILENKSTHAMQILQTLKGVIAADMLEGHPNLLVIIEAGDRQNLVEKMMPVLDSLDRVAEDVHFLMSRESELLPHFVDTGVMVAYQKQSVN
jgi:hypothetical protein